MFGLQNSRQKAHYFNGGMNAGFSFFVNTVFVLAQYFNLYNILYKLKNKGGSSNGYIHNRATDSSST